MTPAGKPQAVLPKYLAKYLVIVLLQFTAAAGLTAIYSMLRSFYQEYGSSSGVGWIVISYLLVAAVSSAFCGRLGDLLGRRFIALLVLVVAGTGALLSALVPTLAGTIVGCAMQGTAGALTPLAIGLARELLDERRVPVALGIISAAGTAGAGIAYLGVGFVVDHFGVQGGFLFKVAVALVAAGALLAFVPRPHQPPGTLAGIDLLRGVLFAPAVTAVLVAVEKGSSWGWNDPRVVAGLAGGWLLLAYWTRHQARERTPLIEVRMLLDRRFALLNLVVIGVALGCIQLGQLFSLIVRQPAWTGVGFGFSATALGWFMLSLNSLAMIVGPSAGVLARRYGARSTAIWGASLSSGAWLLLALSHATLLQTMTAAALVTIGFSLLLPSLYMIIVECVPSSRTSEAGGLAQVGKMTFMAVGAQVLFGILGTDTVTDPNGTAAAFPTDAAYTLTFMYVAGMCLACLILLLAMRPAQVAVKQIDAAARST